MQDYGLETKINIDTSETLVSLAQEVKELAKTGDITYDDYINLQIKHFKGKDTVFMRSLVRDSLGYKGDAHKPNTWREVNSLVEKVKEINTNFVCLLTDPLIVLRAERFIAFAKNYPLYDPETLRQEFIKQFPVKTYYRGIVLREGKEEYPNGHLSPRMRKLIESPDSVVDSYIQDISKLSESIKDWEPNCFGEYIFRMPILGRLLDSTWYHVKSADTRQSEYLSVSEHPEIAWYATCDKKQGLWKHWFKGTKLRVYQFDMSSFYAPSSIDVLAEFLKADIESTRMIDLKDSTGEFAINAMDKGTEQLVPIALPVGFDKNYIDYAPVWDEIMNRPASFQFPRKSDWQRSPNNRAT